jgi:hypothetical protein
VTSTAGPGKPAAPSGWAAARRELVIAGLLVAAVTVAAYAFGGPALAGLSLLVSAAVSLITLRALVEPDMRPAPQVPPDETGPSRTVIGFWRTRSDLDAATRSLGSWQYGLRPRLINLLAARLSERHAVSLADDPEAARRLLLGSRQDLWHWIDPAQPEPTDAGSRPGIPPRVLAALIDRLEKL